MGLHMAQLGETIHKLRKKKKFSLRELGRRADLSHVTISNLEKGKTESPDASTLIALAAPLEVPSSTLLELAGIHDESPTIKNGHDPITRMLLDVFNRLPEEGKQKLLSMALDMLSEK